MSQFSIQFTQFYQKDVKMNDLLLRLILNWCNVYFDLSILQNKGILSHDESRKIVSRITKTIIFLFSYLEMSIFTNSACSLVSILVLLLVVLCRMFFHHVSLEIRGLSALVVAMSTSKRLLTSVRSQVLIQIVRLNAGKVTLVTLKRLLP